MVAEFCGNAIALAVPRRPRCRASGSPEVVKVRRRRSAKPRAMKICSPSERKRSSEGGYTQALLLAKAFAGKAGAEVNKQVRQSEQIAQCNGVLEQSA